MRKIYRQISPAWIAVILFVVLAAAVAAFALSPESFLQSGPEVTPSGSDVIIIDPTGVPLSPPGGGPGLFFVFAGVGLSLALIPIGAFIDKKAGSRR